MKDLLSDEGLRELRLFAQHKTLLGLDYDGTLAPIKDNPDQAFMTAKTRERLRRVAEEFPTVVITGRARLDALRLIDVAGTIEIIGNHGAETADGAPQASHPKVRRWKSILHEKLASVPGIEIEDKKHSISVHFRKSRNRALTRDAVLRIASTLDGVRLVGGKAVLNIVPAEAPDKGTALLTARARARCSRAIFIGDDVTDEDVFSLRRSEPLLAVRVGRSRSSRAAYFLRNQRDVDEVLRLLVQFRRQRQTP